MRLFKLLGNKRGIFGFGASADYSSSKTKSRMEQDIEFKKAPEHEESTKARKTWAELLEEWGGQEGYGAIQPDWAGIWDNAQKKVQQYFWGGVNDPGGGVAGKVKASAARRGVAESPALEKNLTKMAGTEANILSDMAVQQGVEKAKLSESGRMNYLQSLMAMSGQNVQGQFFSPWQTKEGTESGWGVGAKFGMSKN